MKREQIEQRKQRGLWRRRHNLNVVERDELVRLNRKYGTYAGPKSANNETRAPKII